MGHVEEDIDQGGGGAWASGGSRMVSSAAEGCAWGLEEPSREDHKTWDHECIAVLEGSGERQCRETGEEHL